MKQITKLPQPPTTAEPQNFDDRADAFVGALPKFVTETNELAAEVEESLQTVQTLKENADASKQAAQTSAQTASEAKTAAIQGATSAASSVAAAAQIKEQTQAFADAAQSSAQAAKQSEQAAEQTKTELQTATNTLEQMKSIVKDGFIDDTAQSENKTYSSKKISKLNETLSADVTQKLDQASKEIRTAAMSGAMPSAYESDLAMWDYMEHSGAAWVGTIRARFFKDWALGVEKNIRFYAVYPNLNNRIKNNYYVSSTEQITAILDGEVIAAIAQNGTIYKQDGTTTYLNTTNPDGVSISTNNKVDSVAGKFVLYRLGGDNVAVFGLSGDDKVLKYLYKTSVEGIDNNSRYVFHDVLVINKYEAPQKTYKITNTDIREITGVELPASTPRYSTSEFYMPFYKDFLLSKNALIKVDGTVKTIRICGEVLGFLGGTPYLLQRMSPTSGVVYQGGNKKYLYMIFDVENGARCVLLPLDKEPLSAYLEGGYAYIVFKDGVAKIPAKYLTGANYKGE